MSLILLIYSLRLKPIVGVWLSLVEHLVWDQGVAGSNPVTPSAFLIYQCGCSSMVE